MHCCRPAGEPGEYAAYLGDEFSDKAALPKVKRPMPQVRPASGTYDMLRVPGVWVTTEFCLIVRPTCSSHLVLQYRSCLPNTHSCLLGTL